MKSWPTSDPIGGMITSQVSLSSFRLYHFSRMLGRKNSTPVVARHDEEVGGGQQQDLGMAEGLAHGQMC